MFRIIVRIFQLQFLFLCIFLVCYSIAGEKNAPFWFALVAVTLTALTIAGKITQDCADHYRKGLAQESPLASKRWRPQRTNAYLVIPMNSCEFLQWSTSGPSAAGNMVQRSISNAGSFWGVE